MSGPVLLRLFAWLLALGLLALPVVGVLNGSFASERWPLRRLDLKAEQVRVDPAQVQMVVARHAGAGFFALSLSELRAELAALPWVESVQVRKRWPDTVSVTLLEYQPYAIWSNASLVSRSGRLFKVPGIDAITGLPRLSGPDHEVVQVVNFHARAVRELQPVGLSVLATALSDRGSWTLELDGGATIVLGRELAGERLERFAASIDPLLRSRQDAVLRHADLRYPNGFALAWQPLPDPALGEPGAPDAPAAAAAPAAMPAADGPADRDDRIGAGTVLRPGPPARGNERPSLTRAAPAAGQPPITYARASAPRMNPQDPRA
jgi:cell division protein FtsQ